MRYSFLLFVVALFLVNGCVSDYRLAMIREARTFALEEHPDLSDESVHFIKFATPTLRQNLLTSRQIGSENKEDIMQTVVIWDLPDHDGKSLMVVGFGERELDNWSPNRTILKRFREMPTGKKKRVKKKKRSKKERRKKLKAALDLTPSDK